MPDIDHNPSYKIQYIHSSYWHHHNRKNMPEIKDPEHTILYEQIGHDSLIIHLQN